MALVMFRITSEYLISFLVPFTCHLPHNIILVAHAIFSLAPEKLWKSRAESYFKKYMYISHSHIYSFFLLQFNGQWWTLRIVLASPSLTRIPTVLPTALQVPDPAEVPVSTATEPTVTEWLPMAETSWWCRLDNGGETNPPNYPREKTEYTPMTYLRWEKWVVQAATLNIGHPRMFRFLAAFSHPKLAVLYTSSALFSRATSAFHFKSSLVAQTFSYLFISYHISLNSPCTGSQTL